MDSHLARLIAFCVFARPIVGWVLTAVCLAPGSYRTSTIRASTKLGPASRSIDGRFSPAVSRLSRIIPGVESNAPQLFETRASDLSIAGWRQRSWIN